MKEAKYKIGEKVWRMQNDRPLEEIITGIHAVFSPNRENLLEFQYNFDIEVNDVRARWEMEIWLFHTKKELLNSL